MNVDVDPKSMYTYKAYSHHIQNTIAHMAEVPELTKKGPLKKSKVRSDEFLDGLKKQLMDMFLLPLTDDEMTKIRDKKTDNRADTPSILDIGEIIKRKRDLKKLYINIPKKSGFGYRLNYAPGCKD